MLMTSIRISSGIFIVSAEMETFFFFFLFRLSIAIQAHSIDFQQAKSLHLLIHGHTKHVPMDFPTNTNSSIGIAAKMLMRVHTIILGS